MQIEQYIRARRERIEPVLEKLFAENQENILNRAMSHGVLAGGKRLRPLLAYASAETIGGDISNTDTVACAVELVHSYSLIHDDLPAMDDDKLRRGQPTCHIAFGEANAILAGDALQSLAFELLSENEMSGVDETTRLKMINILSRAIGREGMVAGQEMDFSASGTSISEGDLATMHSLKTGALIKASIQMGAMSTGNLQSGQIPLLENFADKMGLAFQVKDDILDVESDTQTLGKLQGKDQLLDKPTYPSMLGMEGAKSKLLELYEDGLASLDAFGESAVPLKGIAGLIINRIH